MTFPFPSAFTDKLTTLLGPESAQRVLEALCLPRTKSIRVNTLKATIEDVHQKLEADGFHLEPVPWYPSAFIVENPEGLSSHPLHEEGAFYIQSLSSMIPVLLLDPQQGERILDIAAAPGSKTSQMAAQMNNSGEIIANDISRGRIFKLKDNLSHLGVTNTTFSTYPGQVVSHLINPPVDRTLADVPCSMEGRFRCDDPESYEGWSQKKVKTLSKEQKGILRSAVRATKPGGLIVYSTCTLSVEENEEVVDWVLRKEPGTLTVEPISLPELETLSGVTHSGRDTFDPQIANTVRILPSKTMEGFFVAVLQKT